MHNASQILGVGQDAPVSEIKSSFYKLAKVYHPDINQGDQSKNDHFLRLSTAYETLSDPTKRRGRDQHTRAFLACDPCLSLLLTK